MIDRVPRYLHAGRPKRHPLYEYELAPAAHEVRSEALILDRWHVGELVWPAIFKRSSEFDRAMFLHVDLLLRSRGAVVVHAWRSTTQLAQDLRAHPEEPINPGDIILARELFDAALHLVSCQRVDYNFEIRDDLGPIIEAAIAQESLVRALNLVTSEWIGSPAPDALLVGDRFGTRHGDAARVPFVPFRDSCGYFLMQELLDSSFTNIAICNATKGDNSLERLELLTELLGNPPIVALGREAESVLHYETSLPYESVPHPQYSRRFERERGPGAYGDRIREAAGYRR